MKFKLLVSIMLLISPVAVVMAHMDSFEQVSKFSLSIDSYGKDKWYYQKASNRVPQSVDVSFVSKHLSRGMMQAFKNYVGDRSYAKVNGSKIFSIHTGLNMKRLVTSGSRVGTVQKNAQPVVSRIMASSADHAEKITAHFGSVVARPSVKSAAAAVAATTFTPVETTTMASSKVAQFAAQHPNKVLPVYLAGALVGGTALYAGMNQAISYMQPKVEVKPNYLQRAKAQVQAGYSSVKANVTKGYTLAMNNKGQTAGAVAVIAALGYAAYKSDIFGKSKAVVTTPEVKPTPVAGLHRIEKQLKD